MKHDPEVLSLVNAKGKEVASVRGFIDGDSIVFPVLPFGGNLKGCTLWIGKHQAHDFLGNVVDPQDIKTRQGLWSGILYLSEPAVREMLYGEHADEYA